MGNYNRINQALKDNRLDSSVVNEKKELPIAGQDLYSRIKLRVVGELTTKNRLYVSILLDGEEVGTIKVISPNNPKGRIRFRFDVFSEFQKREIGVIAFKSFVELVKKIYPDSIGIIFDPTTRYGSAFYETCKRQGLIDGEYVVLWSPEIEQEEVALVQASEIQKLSESSVKMETAGKELEEVLLSEKLTFSLDEVRRGTVMQRLVSMKMIQQIDWLVSFIGKVDQEIMEVARLRQEHLILDDVDSLTFPDGKTMEVDSQECLLRLIEDTRDTTFYKVMLEILTNAYDSCVRRMVGKDIEGGTSIDVGRIDFSMAIKKDNLIICISDNGEGILRGSPSDPIFRHYYGEYDDLINGGQGLGIDIVKALLKYHGGTVEWHESSGYPEGFGTKVVVILPVNDELLNQIIQQLKAQQKNIQEIPLISHIISSSL
jgi:signal transduction histidine kinase